MISQPTDRVFIAVGATLGLIAVAAGAFGAHALRSRLAPDLLATFETAVRYQMYHAVALIGLGLVADRWPAPQIGWAGWLLVVGTVIFSGSLYVLTLTGTRWWGAVTPFGGVCLVAGWACLLWGMLASR